ncbi:hypothetical protein DL89DRAFT_294036 [Linderina pennispora]|uniref:G-protein coupled receptors family 3 profile domain-containing protein n=1 Tax=Linderina pennispora TaxID=61395 RepID=A0A1Y1W5P5_9FUNG|nr:uncharacterized protein DL89DRAFT_294036 [Linderina pennispora]ORX68853.1 hypothetical protein DL89DRAFT_294036 [Linderina pennispora]
MAAQIGYHLDPIGKHDLAVICVFSAIYALDLLAVLYLIRNRNYPSLKSKSPGILVAAYFSSILWFVGDIQVNGLVHLHGTPLTNCKLFGVWLRIILGVCTVSSLVALRAYSLFRVFKQNRPFKGLGMYIPFIIYSIWLVSYGIVSQVLAPSITIKYMDILDVCVYTHAYKASLFIFLWITWLYVAAVNWKIRNIKSSFNESREMGFSCAVVFAVLTFTTVLKYVRPAYLFDRKLRLVTTSLDHIAVNLVWWRLAGVPLVNCMLRQKQYLHYWTNKLSEDGLQQKYDVGSYVISNSSILYSEKLSQIGSYRAGQSKFEHESRPDSPIAWSSHNISSPEVGNYTTAEPTKPATAATLVDSSLPPNALFDLRKTDPRKTIRRKEHLRHASAAKDQVFLPVRPMSPSPVYPNISPPPSAYRLTDRTPGFVYMWGQDSDNASLEYLQAGRRLI